MGAILVAATGGAFATALGSFWGTVATGALAGGAGGAIMTGTLRGALKGAAFGALSAGVAFGVGEAFGHAGGSIFAKGFKTGRALGKALAHAITRGAISHAQGGTFRSGFASGFSASFFDVGTQGYGGFVGRTTIMGIVGGTASEIGGGKFSNGAVSGAFVHMFNAEARGWKARKAMMQNQMNKSRSSYNRLTKSLLARQEFFKDNPTYGSERMTVVGAIISLPLAGLSVLKMGVMAITTAISYPIETITGIVVANDILNPSLPPSTPVGQLYWMYDHRDGEPK